MVHCLTALDAATAPPARPMFSGKRRGLRSGKGSQEPTHDQLYEEAKRQRIQGRSAMDKSQLQRAPGAGKS